MNLRSLAAILLLLLLVVPALPQAGDTTTELLLAKARMLLSRGRNDLAARTWKQVLASDPKNAEALAGLSRYEEQSGNEAGAKQYLDRLRKVQPNAPAPEPVRPAAPRDPRLRNAEALAQAGKNEEAVQVYQSIFGKEPPATVAAQYYETLSGVKGRADEAIAGLERLVKNNPNSDEYRLALGRVQTYRPQTRNDGIRMLKSIPASSAYATRAKAAWRQALIWDNASPGSIALLRDYLAVYPDPALAQLLSSATNAKPKPASQSPQESLGYEALNSGAAETAVTHFENAIRETPRSSSAFAGLGYARMRQRKWVEATQAWDRAVQFAPANKEYAVARADARYFLAMEEGTGALVQGNTAVARQRFETAVALRPASLDAQRGLAGALMAAGESQASARLFEKLVSAEPGTTENWRNLIVSQANAGAQKEALALWHKAPVEVRSALQKDVPFQLLLAGTFLHEKQPKEAAASYEAAARLDPRNAVAWEGWVASLMASNEEVKAYETLSSMPPEVYKQALERPGFLRSAVLIQTQHGRFDVVEALLLKWIAREGADKVPADIQAQLANIWIKQGKTAQAEKLLRDLIAKDPNNADASRLLLAVLQSENRAAEALVESKRIPLMVQAQLQQDPDYVTLIASINSDAGNQSEALRLVRETLSRFSQRGEPAPSNLLLQQAWLLLNSGAEGRELLVVLRSLSSRTDLSPAQQSNYLELWSVWAQRQAAEARRAGNPERSTAILAEASTLFPSDPRIRSAYAGGLVQDGQTKKALAVYKTWGLAGATPTDYSAAIGTAMVEKSDLLKRWLDEAMKKFPSDPQILALAGEQAAQKGDFRRAEIYYRSALALADVKPKTQLAGLAIDRAPTNALGRLLVGDQLPPEGSGPTIDRLGRVLSGETPPENLSAKGAEFVSGIAPVKSESDRIADRLQGITARNTPYFGVSTTVQSRSGTPGFDQRTLLESEISTSKVLANMVRMTLIVRPTSIRTGASDGGSETFRLGLLPAGSSFAGQSVAGLGTEVQLSTSDFGLRLGTSPQGFVVKNYIGGLRLRPAGGHLTIRIMRDNVKDSLLSYSGQTDPITKQVWGGVVANQAEVTGNWGTEKSGFYLSGGYGIITGQNVSTNREFNGNGGSYWRVLTLAESSLTLGLNLTGQAFEKNLRYYTLGQGGYFSPQRFYIFNVPVAWRGTYGTRFRYVLNAGLGTQHFREESSPYFPTLPSLQNVTSLYYPGQSQTGASYSVDFRGMYQLSDQWYLEGFFNLNNARNFTAQMAGFALKYGFKPRPIGVETGPPSVPDWNGIQPFQPWTK